MKGRGHKAEYEFEYETFLWGMVFGDLVEEKVRCFLQTTVPLRIVFAFIQMVFHGCKIFIPVSA
jgi:hypothetical protein